MKQRLDINSYVLIIYFNKFQNLFLYLFSEITFIYACNSLSKFSLKLSIFVFKTQSELCNESVTFLSIYSWLSCRLTNYDNYLYVDISFSKTNLNHNQHISWDSEATESWCCEIWKEFYDTQRQIWASLKTDFWRFKKNSLHI